MGEQERLIGVLDVDVGEVCTVAWAPDGARLMVGGERGRVALTPHGRELGRSADSGWRAAWSRDGRRLAWLSNSSTIEGTIEDGVTGQVLARIPAGLDLAWSPDDRWLAIVDDNSGAKVLDAGTGRYVWTNEVDAESLSAVSWSPDGELLATGRAEGKVRLSSARDGRELAELSVGSGAVPAARWAPQGSLLGVVCWDRVQLWDARDLREPIWHIDLNGGPYDLCWSPCGQLVALGGEAGLVAIFDARSGFGRSRLDGHTDVVNQLAFSPDGSALASGSSDGTVRLWDMADLRTPHRGPSPWFPGMAGEGLGVVYRGVCGAEAVAFAGDGRALFTGDGEGTVRRHELPGGHISWEVRCAERAIVALAVSPNGRQVAVVGSLESLRILDCGDGREALQMDVDRPEGVCWSPDGTRVAVAEHATRVHDTRTGRLLAELPTSGRAYVVAWSSRSPLLAIADGDGNLVVWEADSGRPLHEHRFHEDRIHGLSWSPDGLHLASAHEEGLVRLWAPTSERDPMRLDGHSGLVACAAWSPDGRRLASGSQDETLRVWDPASGAELCQHNAPAGEVTSLCWSPDGTLLASAHGNGTFRLWANDPR